MSGAISRAIAALVNIVILAGLAQAQAVCTINWLPARSEQRPTIDLLKAFELSCRDFSAIRAGFLDKASLGRFADGDEPISVLASSAMPTPQDEIIMRRRMRDLAAKVDIERLGQRTLLMITNAGAPARTASVQLIGKVVSTHGKGLTWTVLGGGNAAIRCYVESADSWSMKFLRQRCMGYEEKRPGSIYRGFYRYRDDLARCSDGADVIAKVKADVNGIGFLQYTGQSLEGVKVLAIAADEDSEAVMPKLEPVMQPDYPLAEPLVLYLHPKALPVAKQFCDFAISHEGSAVLEKLGFVTPTTEFRFHAERRLADLKSGKGDKVAACGAVGGSNALAGRAVREMMGGLAEEFVRAKAVVQVGYSPMATDVAGMGAFLATTGAGEAMRPRQELLLLDDRPSERAMQAHGERWNVLGKLRAAPRATVDESRAAFRSAVDDGASPAVNDNHAASRADAAAGESAGVAVAEAVGYDDGPEEYLIAARGVAVIVNPSNKLNSLTLDQLRSVFSGELQDWSILAGGVAGAGAGGAGKQEIKLFGLPQADVVTQIFAVECLATNQWRRVTIRKSSDEVIKAVASDPAAIGIVDLATVGPVALAGLQSETAASAAGRSVKLLSIDLGRAAGGGAGGLRGAAAMPPIPAIPATADNLKNAMYPLSQRLYLYVHPLASDTAKDFAKFVATCGASEATPYADTVKSMIETYQKNGLIPLADEAINRMAKDALAAATKED